MVGDDKPGLQSSGRIGGKCGKENAQDSTILGLNCPGSRKDSPGWPS